MARKRAKLADCPNCGHQLAQADNYCARCGQENHTHKLPVHHFLVELLSGLFNFDTKLLRTLHDLFWPPGLVVREFNANKRVRYVPPLRLYLFTSVLFFILLAWTTSRLEIGDNDVVVVNSADDEQVQGLRLDFGEDGELSDSTLSALSEYPGLTDHLIDSALVVAGIEPGFWARAAVRVGVKARAGSNGKGAYIQEIFAQFSKLMFILLPLFALLLYLLHLGSGLYYTEHLVFALYFHTVVFIFIAVRLVAGQLFELEDPRAVLTLITLIYLTWSMRVAYQRPWWSTALRTIILVVLYFILVILGFGAAAVLGAF
ncbi:MAG: DUF3667 domain-containing protein [Flavobacteriales bacterium]|nr:DUF3667 domain-containing protein [Flavobacteriales bacterium]